MRIQIKVSPKQYYGAFNCSIKKYNIFLTARGFGEAIGLSPEKLVRIVNFCITKILPPLIRIQIQEANWMRIQNTA
jgi:hypothetical protein